MYKKYNVYDHNITNNTLSLKSAILLRVLQS